MERRKRKTGGAEGGRRRGKKMGGETGWAGCLVGVCRLAAVEGGKAVRGLRAWARSLSQTVGMCARV